MNYQVLARKWRPSNFTEVVGQDHVVKSLMNALQHNRLHHAYLFTGTRGVGKTTIARILAKAINCENLQDYNPCGTCEVCRALDEGRFMDLIEVDAASRTKVEDTRDLLDNAQYAPHHGRYKVYLIDEVHMLSGHSFNALLKTLEEPPPHVKFLLATTDPQKIPVTVLSRCLQFNLKRLLPRQIFTQMQDILKQELIEADSLALQLLARAADGSMRDGLSLLDQAIVYGAGKVTADDVSAMLGTVAQRPVEDMLNALADSDAQAILNKIDEIANIQPDFSTVLQQILQILHRIALAQQIPGAIAHEFDREMIMALSHRFTPEDVQLYYQIALVGQRDLDLAPDSRMGFEMVMLRMLAFKPVAAEIIPIKPKQEQVSLQNSTTTQQSAIKVEQIKPPELIVEKSAKEYSGQVNSSNSWIDMIAIMKLESLTRELANNCVLEHIDDEGCNLLLDASHQQLLTPSREKKLQQALQDYRDAPLKLVVKIERAEIVTPAVQSARDKDDRQQAAVDAINTDANILALKEHFDARVLPGTIEPV
ncbi:DNA polymerase III subunit gamma/tau [Methyloglobulus sp.]|uniref:DNA polymerase III subunit gamma/tau n=1 Tax=Methyloglobulus sp. TaxID=2518622 RepID=UPI0032B77B44